MDSILILSNQDEKLQKFLTKIGYDVKTPAAQGNIKEFLDKNFVDLVLLDNDYDLDLADLCEYLRSATTLSGVPIICLARDEAHAGAIKERGGEKINLVVGNPSIGTLAARIATELRLHKLAGEDPARATLSEMNAALRDLNERFKKELEQARGIQENLLPRKLPKSDKYDLTIVYKPLDEVGGDWYFVNPDAGGKLSVQIADVTGHGLAAAFIGCMTKLA
ncbi:MAG: hypothetical protein J5J00_10605, partial [Deltaproteobacteria bacterium]|nr:hypothetical protein [Deltaproteobacteria bacterium]